MNELFLSNIESEQNKDEELKHIAAEFENLLNWVMTDAAILSFSIQVEVEGHEQSTQLLILTQLLLGLTHD